MEPLKIESLLLMGGQSSRMGSRKELLPFPDGRLAIEHALDTLHSTFLERSSIYISMHSTSQLDAIKFMLEESRSESISADFRSQEPQMQVYKYRHKRCITPIRIIPIFDKHQENIGPAAGLLAAHAMLPEATFLVLGCDYPLLPPSALQQLSLEYIAPVTCFVNDSGFAEPLIAVWGPEALERLKENVAHGRNGLHYAIKQVGGKRVIPLKQEWITGTNTRKEWDEAMDSLPKIGKVDLSKK